MASEQQKIAREIRSLMAHFNEQNEAQIADYLSSYVKRGQVQGLMQVWLMLSNRADSTTGVDRVAAVLATIEFGQQLEQLLTREGGFLDVDETSMD